MFKDRVIAITGAASGIGRALAVHLGQQGAALALSDIDEAGLSATAAELRGEAGRGVIRAWWMFRKLPRSPPGAMT